MRTFFARLAPSRSSSAPAGFRRSVAARGVALAMTAALAPAAAAVVAAPAAQAHSVLVSTTPEQDSTVSTSPESVEIVFNEEISGEFASLTVMSDGENVAEGDPEVEGDAISVKVPELEDGTYTVGYRVVSADGHPVQGSWEFTVEGGASDGASPSSEATAAENAEGTSAGSDSAASDQNANGDDADSDNVADDAEDDGFNVGAAIGILAVLAIVLIGGAAFMLQRHKKNMAQFHQGDE